ncbi:MAG: alpha/beta hydrolase [Janthinobacterium lividum]
MIYKLKITCLLLLFSGSVAWAARVDTVNVRSNSMAKDVKTVVISPQNTVKNIRYPVIYLLHGFSGNYSDWIKKDPELNRFADEDHVIIVCPDGNFGSWYLDSPENSQWKYETFLVTELVGWMDTHYATIANRTGRAITGLSMGGFGALHSAIDHTEVYGAAGSMSGGVDLRPFAKSFGIDMILGKYTEHPDRWEKNSIINMLSVLKPNVLALTLTCGHEDFFHQINDELDAKLWEQKIPHDYAVRPGSHTWEYWIDSLKYQMVFFSQFFNGRKV